MHPIRTALALVCAAALTVTLAGCGSSSDDTLTAKEFRSRADALCAAAEKDTDAIGEKLSESSSETEVRSALDKLVTRTERLVKDIDGLEEPEDLSDGVREMLDSVRAALTKIDGASMDEISSMEDPFADANAKADKLGLDECAD